MSDHFGTADTGSNLKPVGKTKPCLANKKLSNDDPCLYLNG